MIILVVTLYFISCLLFPDVSVSDLEKKAVLITGCDSGFGYELARSSILEVYRFLLGVSLQTDKQS